MTSLIANQSQHLCFDQPQWNRVLAALTADPGRVAVGSLTYEQMRGNSRWIVDKLQAVTTHSIGTSRPELDSWCVVMLATDPIPFELNPDAVISYFKPKFTQQFILLLIGIGINRDGWIGWSIYRDRIEPLTSLEVIGARGFKLASQDAVDETSDTVESDGGRYSRILGAIGPAHASVRQATIAIVGCSRSGTVAATQFAALGVRKLVLFDGDTLEPHNLDGSYLATPEDFGKPKASVLAERLVAYRPDLAIGIVGRPFDEQGTIETSSPFDLLVSCVDNDDARVAVSRVASRRLITHLDIATELSPSGNQQTTAHADVRFLYPRDGCVGCVGGTRLTDEGEFRSYAGSKALSPRRKQPWHIHRRGSLITVNSIAVSMGVQTWISSLQGELTSSTWHRLAWRANGNLQVDTASVSASDLCKLCGS